MAAQLLALAVDARRQGDVIYSELLTTRAGDYLDQAQQMEGSASAPSPIPTPSPAPAPVQQQQQQPQPPKKEE